MYCVWFTSSRTGSFCLYVCFTFLHWCLQFVFLLIVQPSPPPLCVHCLLGFCWGVWRTVSRWQSKSSTPTANNNKRNKWQNISKSQKGKNLLSIMANAIITKKCNFDTMQEKDQKKTTTTCYCPHSPLPVHCRHTWNLWLSVCGWAFVGGQNCWCCGWFCWGFLERIILTHANMSRWFLDSTKN